MFPWRNKKNISIFGLKNSLSVTMKIGRRCREGQYEDREKGTLKIEGTMELSMRGRHYEDREKRYGNKEKGSMKIERRKLWSYEAREKGTMKTERRAP